MGLLFSRLLGLSSESVEYRTPPALFAEISHRWGPFDLDPASTDENHLTARYYTRETDGLSGPWAPARVFVNPPYTRKICRWVEKCSRESRLGAYVVALLPVRTDTSYWHRYILPGIPVAGRADQICYLPGRVRFIAKDGAIQPAPFPSAVVVWAAQTQALTS